MACMTHHCRQCGHVWMNNEPRSRCPYCLVSSVSHDFDEVGDHEPEPEEDECPV